MEEKEYIEKLENLIFKIVEYLSYLKIKDEGDGVLLYEKISDDADILKAEHYNYK